MRIGLLERWTVDGTDKGMPDGDGNGLGSWTCGGAIRLEPKTRINSKEPVSPLEGIYKSL